MTALTSGQDLIRLSVGTEDVEDIIADLSRAFDAIALVMNDNGIDSEKIHDNIQTTVDGITPQTCNNKSDIAVKEVESSVAEML